MTNFTSTAPAWKKLYVQGTSYRIIPSRFPPIQLFERFVSLDELELAYELEALTNDRLLDEVGQISLVAKDDRICGPGSSAIMAAFTHAGVSSRFSNGNFGVYYAAMDVDTALAESRHSRARFMAATNEPPQSIKMRCHSCLVDSHLVDASNNSELLTPNSWEAPQAFGAAVRSSGELGIVYPSVRLSQGLCIAAFKPKVLTPPATQAGLYEYIWNGEMISDVFELSKIG